MGDGGAEGLSATGGGGQGAISLTPDTDRMNVCIFTSSQLGRFIFRGLILSKFKDPQVSSWFCNPQNPQGTRSP